MDTYRDLLGAAHTRDGDAPVAWRVSVYAVALLHGKVLMVEPAWAPGRWDLPGGGVEPEESLLGGAQRECWEETGRRFQAGDPPAMHFLGEDRFYIEPTVEPAGSPFRHSLLFAIEGTADAEAEPGWGGAPDECLQVRWTDPRDLAPANTHPNHWRALQRARLVP